MIHFQNTEFGFNWGAARVIRAFSDKKKEWVTLLIATPQEELQVYVTKTGKVRIHGEAGEWTNPLAKKGT